MSKQSTKKSGPSGIRWTARTITEIAVMTAVLVGGKLALSFLPNIEVVSLLIILYARHFRWKVIPVIGLFILIEMAYYGVNDWVIMYLYVWPLLALIAYLTRNYDSVVLTAIISGAYGLIFGALCSIVYLFISGWQGAVAYWISGLLFDLIHCAGNTVVALVLYKPLSRVMTKYTSGSLHD